MKRVSNPFPEAFALLLPYAKYSLLYAVEKYSLLQLNIYRLVNSQCLRDPKVNALLQEFLPNISA